MMSFEDLLVQIHNRMDAMNQTAELAGVLYELDQDFLTTVTTLMAVRVDLDVASTLRENNDTSFDEDIKAHLVEGLQMLDKARSQMPALHAMLESAQDSITWVLSSHKATAKS
jgi:hypothetical protein